jgi:xanthine dehydrogenase accessory factor
MTLGDSPGVLLDRAAELRRRGTPFVMATVVRSLKPASARAGDRALIFDDQQVGWVGGGCVHTSIQREARLALASGEPRLVRLSPEVQPEDGIVSYPMTCHSGGTLDIYLEPVLPAAELVIVGDSPVAQALSAFAQPLGFTVRESLESIGNPHDAWVVAAAMNSGEDHPQVRAALELDVAYVAMVASRRRTEVFVEELRADGVPDDRISRLKAPAGLDIGAANAAEIALSILAEIVQMRRSRVHEVQPQPERDVAIDPICGMEVDIASAKWTAERDRQTFYFCAPGCRKAFLAAQ